MSKKVTISELIFYSLIGMISSVFLVLLFYWSLRLNSSLGGLIAHSSILYLYVYFLLTMVTIIAFGLEIALVAYRVRRYKLFSYGKTAGGGVGIFIGLLASSCSICGSTLLSIFGVTSGLAFFPFKGLELKFLSFILVAVPLYLLLKDLTKPLYKGKNCPMPNSSKITKKYLLVSLFVLFIITSYAVVQLKSDSFFQKRISAENTAGLSCSHQ